MKLPVGAMIGRYQVLGRLGTGGMGELYRARDTHLDRVVALKTIASSFADDPSAAPRFARERALSAPLEHAHICRVLDAGRDQDIEYLAMEYLEGESLAERLRRGPLPVSEALGYAIEIADALRYAHERGVVHRDLKPANVFLTSSGATLLDFGLAKLRPVQPTVLADADTAALDVSQSGELVGSTPYMSPERLEGHEADHRSDIFGFGVVCYEMLAGRRAFDGTSPAAVVAAILNGEPPAIDVAHPKADAIEWVIRRCLSRRPEDRWQSIADVRVVLTRIAAAGALAPPEPDTRSRQRWMLAAASVAGIGLVLLRPSTPAPHAQIAFTIAAPDGGFTPTEGSIQTAQLAVSPDGRAVAYVAANEDQVARIWLRRLDAVAPAPLLGTEGATYPFWSPDGRSLAFFANGFLQRIDITGGPPRRIAAAAHGRGGSWNRDGVIVFAPGVAGPLRRISRTDGNAVDLTALEPAREETSHRWPCFLPDGTRFLYFSSSSAEEHQGIYLGTLAGEPPVFVARTDRGGAFMSPDQVLMLADSTLVARRYDLKAGRPMSEPVVVAERVGGSSNYYGAFSVSPAGVLAYAGSIARSRLVWFDRTGAQGDTVAGSAQYVDFRLSPDGRSLAVAEVDVGSGQSDIYLIDLSRGSRTRLTATRENDASPVWSSDGRRILIRTNRKLVHDLYVLDASGAVPEQPFQVSEKFKYPTSWSPDRRTILFHQNSETTGWDVFIAPSDPASTPRPLVQSPFNQMQAQFSPDGKWVAYTSDESKKHEVYVRPLDGGGERLHVSVHGGSDPRWNPRGGELFYVAPNGYLTAVSLTARGTGLEVSRLRTLLKVPEPMTRSPYVSLYDVSPDGQRFLIRVPVEDVRSMPVTVLAHWSPPPPR